MFDDTDVPVLSTHRSKVRSPADLDFHANVLKTSITDNIEHHNFGNALAAYTELISLNNKEFVAKDLLSLGILLIQQTMPQNLVNSHIVLLLRQLIALKGPYLEKHVRCLAEIYLSENNIIEATAIIKSKLCIKMSKKLLDELCLNF